MPVIHTIQVPGRQTSPEPIPSALGEWEGCAGEVHTFHEPMVLCMVEIDADSTIYLFCHSDQVDGAVERLKQLLTSGQPLSS